MLKVRALSRLRHYPAPVFPIRVQIALLIVLAILAFLQSRKQAALVDIKSNEHRRRHVVQRCIRALEQNSGRLCLATSRRGARVMQFK
jgi:hypothetical protein